MNDRFSAQLRQHLLESADERPADGQLATVIDGVAGTAQRHPVVARLTWLPGRVGPFPSIALRYGLVALALIAATVAVAIFGGGSSPFRSTVFEGTWTTIDHPDGSTMTLVVGEGTTPAVRFVDELATGGACDLDPVKRFTADGTGEISGSRLVVDFPDGGGCGLMTVEVAGVYEYLANRDMLVDQDGFGWTRVEGVPVGPASQPPATQPPATDPPATEPVPTQAAAEPSATPVPDCLQFPDGGTYRATAGDGVSVTVTVPAVVDGSWIGSPDLFNLVRTPCAGPRPVMIEASIVTEVFADACDMEGETRLVSGASEAIEALVTQEGHDLTGPTDATIAGLPASRLDISVPAEFDDTTCTNGLIRLWIGTNDTGIGPGETMTIYIVDVDGLALAVHAPFSDEAMTPALIAEVDGIIASLEIER